MFVIIAIYLSLRTQHVPYGSRLQVWVRALLPRAVERYVLTAGILTYSLCLRLPIGRANSDVVQQSCLKTWSLQQRACPGFAPDSLFICALTRVQQPLASAKVLLFFDIRK